MMIDFSLLVRRNTYPGAREIFQRICTSIMQTKYPDAKEIRPKPGDEGIDAYVGRIGDKVIVAQDKFFLDPLGDSQKDQIRKSFRKAYQSSYFTLTKWILSLPRNLDIDEQSWWDKWSEGKNKETGVVLELWNESILRGILEKPECKGIRDEYFSEEYEKKINELHKIVSEGFSNIVIYNTGSRHSVLLPYLPVINKDIPPSIDVEGETLSLRNMSLNWRAPTAEEAFQIDFKAIQSIIPALAADPLLIPEVFHEKFINELPDDLKGLLNRIRFINTIDIKEISGLNNLVDFNADLSDPSDKVWMRHIIHLLSSLINAMYIKSNVAGIPGLEHYLPKMRDFIRTISTSKLSKNSQYENIITLLIEIDLFIGSYDQYEVFRETPAGVKFGSLSNKVSFEILDRILKNISYQDMCTQYRELGFGENVSEIISKIDKSSKQIGELLGNNSLTIKEGIMIQNSSRTPKKSLFIIRRDIKTWSPVLYLVVPSDFSEHDTNITIFGTKLLDGCYSTYSMARPPFIITVPTIFELKGRKITRKIELDDIKIGRDEEID